MLPRLLRVTVLAATVVSLASAAEANKGKVATRLVLDHAEISPSYFPGLAQVRLFLTAITLEGSLIPLSGKSDLLFKVGASKQRVPYLQGNFAATEAQLLAAVVVNVGYEYEADLPTISDSVSRALREWPGDSRVVLIRYGAQVEIDARPRNVRSVASEVARSVSDLAAAPPTLLDAVERGIKALERHDTSKSGIHTRKVLVVISDGKDANADPKSYTRIGQAAARAGIRIHSIGYSPVDNRRPLLGLGELSKRSGGTFRWVRSQEGFDPQLRTLADEIGRQYVITFFTPPEQVENQRLTVLHKELSSDSLELGSSRCGKGSCGDDDYCVSQTCVERQTRASWLTYGLYGIAGVAVLTLMLAIIGAVLRRSEEEREASRLRAQQIMAAQQQAQAAQVAHRIVAQGPQGQTIAPVQPGGAVAPRPAATGGRIAGVGPGGANAAPSQASNTPAPTRGFLTVMSGPLTGQSRPLRHGFLIGSSPDCDLCLADPAVSRYHAQIVLDAGGGALLMDQTSSNGTFVNGTRVMQMRLGHGSLIRVGSTEVRFLLG